MRNSEYWRRRLEDVEEALNQDSQAVFAAIEDGYRQAQRAIDLEISDWYRRFADNNSVSMAEARRLLNSRELEELRWDLETYIRNGSSLDPVWRRQLENASARVHVTRLEALKLRTQQHAETFFGNNLDAIDGHLRDVYTDGYYHTLFEMQRGFGVGWRVGQVDERRLDLVMSKPWASDGKMFSERIWSDRTTLVGELHTQLTRACMLGKGPDEAIKAISKRFETSAHNAGRLVMTESAAMYSISQGGAYRELGVQRYRVVATLDNDTSDICKALDGRVYDMKDYKPGDTAPPFHPWCRTVTIPEFDDNGYGERAARGRDGKTYFVPADMTYEEWYATFVEPPAEADGGLPAVPAGATMGIEACTSIEELNAVVYEHLKDYGVELVDFRGMDLELAKANAVQLEQLQTQYSTDLASITSEQLGNRTYAQVARSWGDPAAFLQMNQRFYSNPQKMVDDYVRDVAHKWHPADTQLLPEIAVVTHEFAHTLSNSRQGYNPEFWDGVRSVKRRYTRRLNQLTGARTGGVTTREALQEAQHIFISDYARQNVDEFMAEAFTMAVMSNEPSPYALEVLDLIEQYFGR